MSVSIVYQIITKDCYTVPFVFQRNDIAMAISKYDQFDFLIDIVPREEVRPAKRVSASVLSLYRHATNHITCSIPTDYC